VPVFMVERNFAERLEISPAAASAVNRINGDAGVNWIVSFLSADKKKTYCLYEAPSAEAIREAARQAGLPADEIVEVGSEISRTGLTGALDTGRYAG